MARIGYARVSTIDQDLNLQQAKLEAEGCGATHQLGPLLVEPDGCPMGSIQLTEDALQALVRRCYALKCCVSAYSSHFKLCDHVRPPRAIVAFLQIAPSIL
jgi:hypothetical protein